MDTQPSTTFDAICASLRRAAEFNHDDTVRPAAVLWPDEKREWERLVPRLRTSLPHFLVFGPYEKVARSGPAIWLRCVLSGTIPEVSLAPEAVPIIYLPGVSRATLRATEDCPNELKPLAELQYRGVFWSQYNGKDWTVTAFLQTNHGGLQLKIARDQATATAIRRALEKLVDVPLAELQAKSAAGELNSTYFHLLISDDPVDDLLAWLADPDGTRTRWELERWEALCSDCLKNYGFDPIRDGAIVGAELLGLQSKPAWRTAWKRFAAAPSRYAGLIDQLRRAKPKAKGETLFQQADEAWPQDNEQEEARLRQALSEIGGKPAADARQTLRELESHHQHRREWIWGRLNQAPLAHALQHLATLADVSRTPLSGATVAEMVKVYTETGWKADAAVLEALAAVSNTTDREAVCAAVAHVYTPWLRDAAELFQQRVVQEPLPGRDVPRSADVSNGTCLLFADGLRYDVAQKLKTLLEPKLGPLALGHQYVALPSVTPTAKPAVSPVAGKIAGTAVGEEFRPCVAQDGKELTIERFRKLLTGSGYQILAANDTGDPKGRAWTEFGNLDETGQHEGIGLARRIPELLASLVQRVESLLGAGWKEVRIVTDHGWLLVPNGLPRTDLPKYLTATRWGRCAVVKASSTVRLPTFTWFWADDVRVACPPGIDSFVAGKEYGHGGLSLQECVVPQLTIQAAKQPVASAKVESFKWAGLRCRIKVEGQFSGCRVDLRDKVADPATSLVGAARPVGVDGTASLTVKAEFDSREGSASMLVLLDPAGSVLDKTPVTVGG
jgi:hypothetical protein